MYTVFGKIKIEEQTVWDKHRNREIRPIVQACGIRSHGYSLRLQRVMTDFAADTSFDRAADKVEEHYGMRIGGSSCRVIALKHAQASADQSVPKASSRKALTLIAEADGSMIPIVMIAKEATGDKRKARTLCWKEAKLSLVRRAEEKTTLVAATMSDVHACGSQWYALAEAAGLGKGTHIHAVGDGAPWITDQVERQFGKQASYLLDFYHVCEYLGPVSAYAGTAAETWFKQQKDRLRNNEYKAVLKDIQVWLKADNPESPVTECYRYMHTREHQLDYRGAIAANLPIGSGEIESAHRDVIQARLKRPGAWWALENAQAMLDLQALRHNEQWSVYWEQFKQAA